MSLERALKDLDPDFVARTAGGVLDKAEELSVAIEMADRLAEDFPALHALVAHMRGWLEATADPKTARQMGIGVTMAALVISECAQTEALRQQFPDAPSA